MDWAKTTARGYRNSLALVFGATYARGFTIIVESYIIENECSIHKIVIYSYQT